MNFHIKKLPDFKGKHTFNITLLILFVFFVLVVFFNEEFINILKVFKS